MAIIHALYELFSDGTNSSLDYSKVMGALGFAAFFVVSVYAYGYKGTTFSPIEWATGFGVILAAAGGVAKLRDKTAIEPKESAP